MKDSPWKVCGRTTSDDEMQENEENGEEREIECREEKSATQ